MVGHGGSSAGSYLADPTSPIPSHCASIVGTSTLRVNMRLLLHVITVNTSRPGIITSEYIPYYMFQPIKQINTSVYFHAPLTFIGLVNVSTRHDPFG